jgi:uncharacterized protein DUF669
MTTTSDSLLPDDTDNSEYDVEDLRVDFSSQEASSEGRDFSPVPTGKYHVRVDNIEWKKCGPNAKAANVGKPFWNIDMIIQEGEHAGRHLFDSCMLFSGALYTLAQLMKAIGKEVGEGSFKIPSVDEVINQEFVVFVQRKRDSYREKENGDGVPQYKNDVKSYFPLSEANLQSASAKSGSGALLP